MLRQSYRYALYLSLFMPFSLFDFLDHYESDASEWAYNCVHMDHDADIPCLAIFNTMKYNLTAFMLLFDHPSSKCWPHTGQTVGCPGKKKYNLIKCPWASNHCRKDLLQLWRDKNRTGVLIMESIKEKHIYTQILQQSRFCLAPWLKILLVHLCDFSCVAIPSSA